MQLELGTAIKSLLIEQIGFLVIFFNIGKDWAITTVGRMS